MAKIITDEEMALMEAQQESTPNIVTDEEMARLEKAEEEKGIIDTVKEGFEDFTKSIDPLGAGSVVGPAIQAGIEQGVELFGGEGAYPGQQTFGEAYTAAREADKAARTEREERSPFLSTAGSITGDIIVPVPFGAVKGIAGAATRVGAETGIAATRELMQEGEVGDETLMAGGIQAGIEALPVVGKIAKGIGRGVKKTAQKIDKVTSERLIKDIAKAHPQKIKLNVESLIDDPSILNKIIDKIPEHKLMTFEVPDAVILATLGLKGVAAKKVGFALADPKFRIKVLKKVQNSERFIARTEKLAKKLKLSPEQIQKLRARQPMTKKAVAEQAAAPKVSPFLPGKERGAIKLPLGKQRSQDVSDLLGNFDPKGGFGSGKFPSARLELLKDLNKLNKTGKLNPKQRAEYNKLLKDLLETKAGKEAIKKIRSKKKLSKDLTTTEGKKLQDIADKYNTSIDVVGSRARKEGRSIWSDVPVGKGKGTKSDIDVLIDGQVDIDSGGRLSEEIAKMGGNTRPMKYDPKDGPRIRIKPKKKRK